jgi:hypothetical protein
MSRQLLCRKCGDPYDLHALDKQHGFFMRKTFVALGANAHGVTVNGEFTPMNNYHCDKCDELIDNTVVVAASIFTLEKPLGNWEEDFGEVMPIEAVQALDKLLK